MVAIFVWSCYFSLIINAFVNGTLNCFRLLITIFKFSHSCTSFFLFSLLPVCIFLPTTFFPLSSCFLSCLCLDCNAREIINNNFFISHNSARHTNKTMDIKQGAFKYEWWWVRQITYVKASGMGRYAIHYKDQLKMYVSIQIIMYNVFKQNHAQSHNKTRYIRTLKNSFAFIRIFPTRFVHATTSLTFSMCCSKGWWFKTLLSGTHWSALAKTDQRSVTLSYKIKSKHSQKHLLIRISCYCCP